MKFSVSICVYMKDDPLNFDQALASIFNQSIVPNEVILVVDGPVPDSIDTVIFSYQSIYSQLKVIRLEENVGHGNARRIGLSYCTSDIVAIMDSDDISVYDRFEKELNCFKNDPELSIVGSNIAEFINDPGNVVAYRNVPEKHNDIVKYLKKRCPLNQMTVMFKVKDVNNAGGYLDWYWNEDYYLWIRMYLNGAKFYNVQENLVYARAGIDMYRRRGGLKYFLSERKLQKYMRKNKIIGFGTYFMNVSKRFIVQVLLPNKIRGWVFRKFARKQD